MANINSYTNITQFGSLDLNKYSLDQAQVQNSGSAPGTPVSGQIYFDTTLSKFGVYNGATWDYMGSVNSVTWKNAADFTINYLKTTTGAPAVGAGLTIGEILLNTFDKTYYTATSATTWSASTPFTANMVAIFNVSGTGTSAGSTPTANQNTYTNDAGTMVTYTPVAGDAIIIKTETDRFYIFDGANWDAIVGENNTASNGVKIVTGATADIQLDIPGLGAVAVDTSSTSTDLIVFYDGSGSVHAKANMFTFIGSIASGTIITQDPTTGKLIVTAATQVEAQTATNTTKVVIPTSLVNNAWTRTLNIAAIDWVDDGSGVAYKVDFAASLGGGGTGFTKVSSVQAKDASGNLIQLGHIITGGAVSMRSNLNTVVATIELTGTGYTA